MGIVYSKRGKPINFDDFSGDVIAMGNSSMNARGDKLGSGGKIKESRKDQDRKFRATQAYAQTSNSVKQVSLSSKSLVPDNVKVMTPQEALAKTQRIEAKQRKELKAKLDAPIEAPKINYQPSPENEPEGEKKPGSTYADVIGEPITEEVTEKTTEEAPKKKGRKIVDNES